MVARPGRFNRAADAGSQSVRPALERPAFVSEHRPTTNYLLKYISDLFV